MKIWILLPVVLCLSGPARGTNLSDAMKASANDDKTPLEKSGSSSSDASKSNNDDDTYGNSTVPYFGLAIIDNFHGARYKSVQYNYQIPLDAEYVSPFGGVVQSMTRLSATPLSAEGEHAFFGFYVNAGLVDFRSGSLPAQATDLSTTIGFGAEFRCYLTAAERAWSPYWAVRLGWQGLNWDYRNSVVLSDGSTLSSDGLGGLDACTGLGIAWHRNRPVSAYAEAGYGGTTFTQDTWQGFHNDVFKGYAYLSVKAGVSFKF
jgi:hypothetical protein